MKLACFASALALLPASLAFAPGSSRTPFQRKSSLNGFLSDIFADRSGTEEDEKKTIVERFGNSLRKGIVGQFREQTQEEKETYYKNKGAENFEYIPTKEMTGVEPYITRLCATMSQQCYELMDHKREEFVLSTKEHEVDVFITEMQGKFNATSPTFGACVTGDTMILCWRGTSFEAAPTDVLNDVAFSPTSSVVWRKHAKTIKLQGAMASLCLNDLASHEDEIIAMCKKHGIKEIVTSGHSLGGGIGQCAHTIIRAQMEDEYSPWNEIGDVNVRSVVFSAPMTTLLTDDYTEETEKFVDDIDDNSCNIILNNDWVPRSYGYLSFLNDFADDALDDLAKGLSDNMALSLVARRVVNKIQNIAADTAADSDGFGNLVGVMSNYIHPGKIIYYKDSEAEPRVLKDMGAFDNNSGKKDTFRSVKYKPVRNAVDSWEDWHMDILPGLQYDNSMVH